MNTQSINITNIIDQYGHNQLKNDGNIQIIQSFSHNQLKILLKYSLNIMEMYLLQNVLL